jgi:hypothetical protein
MSDNVYEAKWKIVEEVVAQWKTFIIL